MFQFRKGMNGTRYNLLKRFVKPLRDEKFVAISLLNISRSKFGIVYSLVCIFGFSIYTTSYFEAIGSLALMLLVVVVIEAGAVSNEVLVVVDVAVAVVASVGCGDAVVVGTLFFGSVSFGWFVA